MKRALVISSQVAASSVGANNSAYCLRRLGVETVILPTTLMGRHPGWGTPGGGVTPIAILSDIWSGIQAQKLFFDAVLTGYMGSVENAQFASEVIQSVKAGNPEATIVVDPVMGDQGKLYIPEDVAQTIMHELIPLADIITPNVWEFSHMVQKKFTDIKSIQKALLDYGGCALVTSVKHHGLIGALSYHSSGLTYFGHEQFDRVPNGGGDALAGLLLAHTLNDIVDEEAARRAVSSVFEIMRHANENGDTEFPLTAQQHCIEKANLLSMSRIL